jgi:putative oxidoreductase
MNLAPLESFFARIGLWLQPVLLLVIRLYWGWEFILTGWGKLTHLARTADYFASLNLPAPMVAAALTGGVEVAGGALLLLGLFTRFATPALLLVLCGAYATAERDALMTIVSDPDKFTGATPFLFLFATLVVFAFGPGKLSLDAMARSRE